MFLQNPLRSRWHMGDRVVFFICYPQQVLSPVHRLDPAACLSVSLNTSSAVEVFVQVCGRVLAWRTKAATARSNKGTWLRLPPTSHPAACALGQETGFKGRGEEKKGARWWGRRRLMGIRVSLCVTLCSVKMFLKTESWLQNQRVSVTLSVQHTAPYSVPHQSHWDWTSWTSIRVKVVEIWINTSRIKSVRWTVSSKKTTSALLHDTLTRSSFLLSFLLVSFVTFIFYSSYPFFSSHPSLLLFSFSFLNSSYSFFLFPSSPLSILSFFYFLPCFPTSFHRSFLGFVPVVSSFQWETV